MMPQTVEDLGRAVKAKYAGTYDDLPDAELGARIQTKYPGAYDDYQPISVRKESLPTAQASPPPAGNEQAPWYKEVLDRIGNVISGPQTVAGRLFSDQRTPTQHLGPDRHPRPDATLADFNALGAQDLIPDVGPKTKMARGLVEGTQNFATGLATPANVGLAAATGGLGEAAPVIAKFISGGFSVQMLHDAFQRSPEFAELVSKGDYEGASKTLTEIGLGAAAGVLSAKHAASPEGLSAPGPKDVSRETIRRTSPEPVSAEESARILERVQRPAPQR